MRERVFDLIFLIGFLLKGINGIAEIIGGAIFIFITPDQLMKIVTDFTAEGLRKNPHDFIGNFLLHSIARFDDGTITFLSAYLLVHGIVKVAIVVALYLGQRKVYPWTIAALVGFTIYQVYAVITSPNAGMIFLTIVDILIIALTWREWRHNRTLRQATHSTFIWLKYLRRNVFKLGFKK